MADETPTPPPATVAIPPGIVIALQLLSALSGSHWIRSAIMAIATMFGTLQLAKQEIPAAVEKAAKELPKKIINLPRTSTDAIGRLRIGNSGCTATIVGPIDADDAKIELLTAAHCIRVNDAAMFTMHDGRILHCKCVSRDAGADAAWLVADNPKGDLPYLLLADDMPQRGEAVFHQGFGIDRPGNKEVGLFEQVADNGRKCMYRLNVSPGDSGGAIVLDRDFSILSPVCCSSNRGGMGDVFGATPMACAKIRPSRVADGEEPGLYIPILPIDDSPEMEEWAKL